jgi:hypothetical protein
VLVWAFVGIALKHAAVPPVTMAAWLATAVVAVFVVVAGLRGRNALPQADARA